MVVPAAPPKRTDGEAAFRHARLAVTTALVLVLLLVAVPLLRWRSTHYVITTHRLLYRTGILTAVAIAAGLLNPNEVRAMENRNPYEGGEVFTRPVNSAPVDRDKAGPEEPGNAD